VKSKRKSKTSKHNSGKGGGKSPESCLVSSAANKKVDEETTSKNSVDASSMSQAKNSSVDRTSKTSGKPQRAGRIKSFFRGVIYFLSLIPILAYSLTFFADQSFLFNTLANFQLQIFGGLLICLLGSVCLKCFRWASFVGLAVAFCGSSIFAIYLGGQSPVDGGDRVRILSANVLHSNDKFDELEAIIAKKDPDILVLIELSPRWASQIQLLESRFPYRILEPRVMGAGIGIFSKVKLEHPHVYQLSPEIRDCPMFRFQFGLDGETVDCFVVHPLSPREAEWQELRDDQLMEMAKVVNRYEGHRVVVGDFNATTWLPSMRRFQNSTDLRDSRQGFGILPTWPAEFWPASIAIDHAFVSKKIGVSERTVEAYFGSDHYPIFMEIGLAEKKDP